MIEWKDITVFIFEKLTETGLDQLTHSQKFVETLQKLGVDPEPPPDFEGCYVHTLGLFRILDGKYHKLAFFGQK